MTQITLDRSIVDRLKAADDVVELVDESGKLVGTFVPTSAAPHRYPGEPALSIDELDRRIAEPGGRSLSAILADLKKRP